MVSGLVAMEREQIDESCPSICGWPLAGADEAGSGGGATGELRSINIHRQDSDPSSGPTPPSRYTPSALLLPAGGHSSQHGSPMRVVAEGAQPLRTGIG